MPVNAPISNPIDIGLPTIPAKLEDKKVQTEIELLYQAVRNLHAAFNGDSFSAYLPTANQAIVSGVATKITLSAETFDSLASFDLTTNYRFQPTIAGYYQINWSAYLAANAGTMTNVVSFIYKNGAVNKSGGQYIGGGISYFISQGSALIYLNGTTDYLELYAYIAGTTPLVLFGATNTYLDGFLTRRG